MKKTFTSLLLLIISVGFLQAQTVVTLLLPDPCSSETTHIDDVDFQTAPNEFDFIISPNPNAGKFTVSLKSKKPLGLMQIEIYNLQGAIQMRTQIFSENNECIKTFDMNSASDGMYLIVVRGKDVSKSKKIIVSKK